MYEEYQGRKFQRWTVIEPSSALMWLCECECGTHKTVNRKNLLAGKSRSCGCLQREVIGAIRRKHGLTDSGLYRSWADMKKRCQNPNHKNYADYGGRGISVCERWQTAENFIADMGDTWFQGATLDRWNSEKDYAPGNCHWIPQSEQWRNRRKTLMVSTPWGYMTAMDAARRAGIPYGTLQQRLRHGCPPERLFDPSQRPAGRPRRA